jgi:1,4-alpha-glucan branching enzyme
MLHTYFATKHELGEAEEIKRFTERLHGEGIGVMLGLDAREGTDDDIRLMIESIGYWSDAYHVDGAVIIADTDASDALKLVRRRYKDLLVVDGRAVLEHGRVNINEIDGLCDDWRRFAAMRAVMTYKTVMPFVNITPMGEEIGAEALSDPAATVDWNLLDRELNAKFQLFCSKLNYAYLGCARWWNCRDGEVTVSGDGCPDGVLTVRRTSAAGDILAVINLRPTVYENFSIDATEREYREIFNSDARLYGGSGVTNEGVIKSAPVNEKEKIRIRIPPLAATVLLSVKI